METDRETDSRVSSHKNNNERMKINVLLLGDTEYLLYIYNDFDLNTLFIPVYHANI